MTAPHPSSDANFPRLFVGIPAPPAVQNAVRQVGAAWEPADAWRWTSPESVHLTLRFLGATCPVQCAALEDSLAQIANTCSAFVIQLSGLGTFPERGRARVLWIGLRGDLSTAAKLAAKVEQAARGGGFAAETRPWRPHLTIARSRSLDGRSLDSRSLDSTMDLRETWQEKPVPQTDWMVEAFELIRSELSPLGPRYTTLRRFPLTG